MIEGSFFPLSSNVNAVSAGVNYMLESKSNMYWLHVAHNLRERQTRFFPEAISMPYRALAMPGSWPESCVYPWAKLSLCSMEWVSSVGRRRSRAWDGKWHVYWGSDLRKNLWGGEECRIGLGKVLGKLEEPTEFFLVWPAGSSEA